MKQASFLLLSVILFSGCAEAQPAMIHGNGWHMVKEIVFTQDAKSTNTQVKLKDFSQMDRLLFNNAHQLTTISYGDSARYNYAIKDSVLTFWPAEQKNKTTEYRVLVSTNDSLVLRRTEIRGTDRSLKITATLHLAANK